MRPQKAWKSGLIGGAAGASAGVPPLIAYATVVIFDSLKFQHYDWEMVGMFGVFSGVGGVIGFVIGYTDYREPGEKSLLHKWGERWSRRVCIGLLAIPLGWMVVACGAFLALEAGNHRLLPHVDHSVIAGSALCGSGVSIMVGGFLGALFTPARYGDWSWPIVKSSLMAIMLSGLLGAWVGGPIGAVRLLSLGNINASEAVNIAMSTGVPAGIMAAIVLRLRFNR